MMSALLRPMLDADIPDVFQIELVSQAFPWSEKLLKEAIPHGAWVLHHNNTVQAFCFFMQILDEIHLLNIAVHPEYRRQGLAQSLLKALHDHAVQKNCVCIFLEARASNQNAISLYKKIGYEQISIRRAYYPIDGGREDAVIMRKPLGINT